MYRRFTIDPLKVDEEQQKLLSALSAAVEATDRLFWLQTSTNKRSLYPDGIKKSDLTTSELANPYTVVQRRNGRYVGIPYHQIYAPEVRRIVKHVRKAASGLSKGDPFRAFLETRAISLLTDDYDPSDIKWLQLKNQSVDLNIGPIETYHDEILGRKKFYTGVLGLVDQELTNRFQHVAAQAEEFERLLPVPCPNRPQSLRVEVQDVVCWSGELAELVPIGWSRPDEPKVYNQYGTKKMLFRNIANLKLDQLYLPVLEAIFGQRVVERYQADWSEYFVYMIAFHEVAHTLGKYPEMPERLGVYLNYIEEAKADLLGQRISWELSQLGKIPPAAYEVGLYTSLAAGLHFMKVVEETPARAPYAFIGRLVWGELIDQGVISKKGKDWRLDLEQAPKVISALVNRIIKLAACAKEPEVEIEVGGIISDKHFEPLVARLVGVPTKLRISQLESKAVLS